MGKQPIWAMKLKRKNPVAPMAFLPLAKPGFSRMGIQNPFNGGNTLAGVGGAALALGANIAVAKLAPVAWDIKPIASFGMAALACFPRSSRLAAGFAGAQIYAGMMEMYQHSKVEQHRAL